MGRQDQTMTAHQRQVAGVSEVPHAYLTAHSLLTLAAVILQADPPVVPLEFSMQLCMDP